MLDEHVRLIPAVLQVNNVTHINEHAARLPQNKFIVYIKKFMKSPSLQTNFTIVFAFLDNDYN
jgi:hypothetical protein